MVVFRRSLYSLSLKFHSEIASERMPRSGRDVRRALSFLESPWSGSSKEDPSIWISLVLDCIHSEHRLHRVNDNNHCKARSNRGAGRALGRLVLRTQDEAWRLGSVRLDGSIEGGTRKRNVQRGISGAARIHRRVRLQHHRR